MSDKLEKIIFTFFIISFILGLFGVIIALIVQAWLVIEGVKAVEEMGGFAGLFEKILQIFS